MGIWGIIGGSGLERIDGLHERREESLVTPYGPPSGPLVHARLGQQPIVFLSRHGIGHGLAPHEINYRANLWALRGAGVSRIVAIGAVGSITEPPGPGGLGVPDQLIDYTHGRAHTYYEGPETGVDHVGFASPYSPGVRDDLLKAAHAAGVEAVDGGCYGVTQGPRLETAAEIKRLERDGCTMVGMTAMPEAALARELGIDYGACCVVANRAAGKEVGALDMAAIREHLGAGMQAVRALLAELAPR